MEALEEIGHTSRTTVAAMERVVLAQRPAIKLFVSSVGESCSVARIGDAPNGTISADVATRDLIDAPEAAEIRETTDYEIFISEFDYLDVPSYNHGGGTVPTKVKRQSPAALSQTIHQPSERQPFLPVYGYRL
jgi:hypothetical protein